MCSSSLVRELTELWKQLKPVAQVISAPSDTPIFSVQLLVEGGYWEGCCYVGMHYPVLELMLPSC